MLTPSFSAHFLRARRASAPTCSIWGFVSGRPAFLVCRITTSSISTCSRAKRTILARSPLTRDSSVIASLKSMGRRSVSPGRSSVLSCVFDLGDLPFWATTCVTFRSWRLLSFIPGNHSNRHRTKCVVHLTSLSTTASIEPGLSLSLVPGYGRLLPFRDGKKNSGIRASSGGTPNEN